MRKFAALAAEMLTPVKSITYIATHIGHLGTRISATLGMTQPASSAPRRRSDAGLAELWQFAGAE